MYNYTQMLTSSPLTLYIIFIFAFLVTFDTQFLLFLTLFLIFGIVLNVCLKQIIQQDRPPAAGGCGLYTDFYKKSTFGMPSMHAQIWSIFSLFWSIYIIRNMHHCTFKKIISISIFFALLLIVCHQRVSSSCHTTKQVIVGCLVGFISACIMYKICMCILPHKFK